MTSRAVTVGDLPAAAIEQVLLCLSPVDRAAASATCRTWRSIEVSSRLLYGDLTLDGQCLGPGCGSEGAYSVGSWLAARLEAIQHFKLWTPYPLDSLASGVVDLLASANKLMSLQYVSSDRSLSRTLGSLAKLTSLRALQILVPSDGGAALALRARDISKLKPLRNLRAIRLNVSEIRGGLPAPLLKAWSRLESLHITARFRMAGESLRHLTSLQRLELNGVTLTPPDAKTAARLTALTHLSIAPAAEDAPRWQELELWEALHRLPSLSTLQASVDMFAFLQSGNPAGMHDDHQLVVSDAGENGTIPEGILACRHLQRLVLPMMVAGLPELRPGQLPSLTRLELPDSLAERWPASWAAQLPTLRALALNGAARLARHLPQEFAQLRKLERLELRACGLETLPGPVAALPRLKKLDLGINRLVDLPSGPYLTSLEWLCLRQNPTLRRVPKALLEAQRLGTIDVGECDTLDLSPADVRGVVARLPALRVLVLARGQGANGWPAPAVAALMELSRLAPDVMVLLERTEAAVGALGDEDELDDMAADTTISA